ncbi:MAG TPA: TonB-dependent receptor [Chitinophagaceae bacterium]|nr:TonB-dependent receptor [Chitinophagaceae bacterium]
MKNLTLLLFFIAGTFTLQAQFPGGGPGKAAPNMGHVYGKLVDSSGKPISDATVLLLHNKYDSATKKTKQVLLKGLTTTAKGEFSFEDLPIFGPLKLKISATGYKPIEQNVVFQVKMPAGGVPKNVTDPAQAANAMSGTINGFDKDLGNIRMKVDEAQLQTVTVTATKPTLKMDIDKKVYNVEKDIVNAGGTALDVMKNVPSVNVDIDGNLTLRNAPPQLYIDGRPTTLTLDQIPADAIESVEVITNPSAKYDASGGSAGIVNIILKKNRKTGYNGNVRGGVDSHGAINAGLNFNVRQNKFNFTANGFFNQNKGVTNGDVSRYNYTDTPTSIDQTLYDKNHGAFAFGSLGLDFFATNRTTFSLTALHVHGEFKPNQLMNVTNSYYYPGTTETDYSQRNANSSRVFDANGLQFAFKHLFPREGENITADANYFGGMNHNNSLTSTDYLTGMPGSPVAFTQQQMVDGNGTNRFLTIQTDYVRPFNSKTKLETGLRMFSQHLENNSYTYYDTTGKGNYYPISAATVNYQNTNNVYAGYVSFTSAIKDFGYQAGLRAESSNYTGELINEKQNYNNSYPISLFPSLFLSQKLKNKQELQISYTRRINRPNFFQLIPFTNYSDSLNITRGNPDLLPEFTNSLEFSYLKTMTGNNTFLASLYYKKTDQLITRYVDTFTNAISGKQDLVNTWVNANYSQMVGAEFTAVNTITSWWDLTTNVNVYNSYINTNNLPAASQPALWSWYGKLNTNFKLPWKLKLQITGFYQSKSNLPVNTGGGGPGMGPGGGGPGSASQGYIASFWAVDAAMSRNFLKNDAGMVSISISDIFRSRWSDQYSFQEGLFDQQYNRLRDPQLVRINFTYRFGKMDVSLFKRKNMNGTGSQDAMQGMQ